MSVRAELDALRSTVGGAATAARIGALPPLGEVRPFSAANASQLATDAYSDPARVAYVKRVATLWDKANVVFGLIKGALTKLVDKLKKALDALEDFARNHPLAAAAIAGIVSGCIIFAALFALHFFAVRNRESRVGKAVFGAWVPVITASKRLLRTASGRFLQTPAPVRTTQSAVRALAGVPLAQRSDMINNPLHGGGQPAAVRVGRSSMRAVFAPTAVPHP